MQPEGLGADRGLQPWFKGLSRKSAGVLPPTTAVGSSSQSATSEAGSEAELSQKKLSVKLLIV